MDHLEENSGEGDLDVGQLEEWYPAEALDLEAGEEMATAKEEIVKSRERIEELQEEVDTNERRYSDGRAGVFDALHLHPRCIKSRLD